MKETFFISHGSPAMSTDESLPASHFLKSFKETALREKPKFILVISAHWETEEPSVSALDGIYTTTYDFGNFPTVKPGMEYPARGSPELARRVAELLAGAGFEHVVEDNERGLDHGTWVPLMLIFPEADIPVCELSVQTNKDATHHLKLGRALAPLKEEGVLIIGSGGATHNFEGMDQLVGNTVAPWAMEFDTWLKDALLEGRYEDVNRYIEQAPKAKVAHPSPEHLYPLHVALGAAGEEPKAELIHASWDDGVVSFSSYKFTSKS